MQGFAFGTIIENSDKDHIGMLKVSVPAANQGGEVFWANVLVPYAGNGHGVYFTPEIGDSVVVGFIGESRTPVVMGCFLSGADAISPKTAGNRTKAIHTKGGHKIIFADGDDGVLTVQTGQGMPLPLR